MKTLNKLTKKQGIEEMKKFEGKTQKFISLQNNKENNNTIDKMITGLDATEQQHIDRCFKERFVESVTNNTVDVITNNSHLKLKGTTFYTYKTEKGFNFLIARNEYFTILYI